LGISYACEDFESEIVFYQSILQSFGFSLYEEPSNDPNAKWLFAGNIDNWQSSLFEIVLTKNTLNPENDWRPHFQPLLT